MEIYTEILGNIHTPQWQEKIKDYEIEYLNLDQWTAQKSRFVALSDHDREYAVALARHTQLLNGDILSCCEQKKHLIVVRICLNDVMVIGLDALAGMEKEEIIRAAVELGHAIGNQHWPAVVKGMTVYVPLTVDKKVMESVMHTHNFEHVSVSFRHGDEIIPYLAPHEIRRLFGGAEPLEGHHHHHCH